MHAFTSCSASGRIVNAYANNFEALKSNGFIYVEIENTGEVTSEFSVSCHCHAACELCCCKVLIG